MWADKLKKADVSIHVIATGGGAGLQQELWSIPGSSAYLSGASFPYAMEETEELLGFKPESFCSVEAAIDLASAAYMKAYRFGGRKPVGLGITASVASETAHRGDHRVFACIITDDQVRTVHHVMEKGVGQGPRLLDGAVCDDMGLYLLLDTLTDEKFETETNAGFADKMARMRFLQRPFFTVDGKRYRELYKLSDMEAEIDSNQFALMPGAFNPPHVGHLGLANNFRKKHGKRVVFEVTANPPHKDGLTVQDMLKRAKMLQGYDRFFSTNIPMYLDKARAYPGMPLLLGADAMVRLLDPKWGIDMRKMIKEFHALRTTLYVAERLVDGKPVDYEDVITDYMEDKLSNHELDMAYEVIQECPGRWDVSSTELRNKAK